MENNRFNNNIRVMVEEAGAESPSTRWEEAVNETARIHPSLPQIIDQAARHVPGSSSDPKETAHRIGDAALREVAATGKDRLTDLQEMILARRVFRSTLIQEGAAQILKERHTGVRSMEDFMGLKAALGNNAAENNDGLGQRSLAMLKQNASFDMRDATTDATVNDLKALSVGAYDRVSDKTREALVKVLEVSPAELGDRYPATVIGNEPIARPLRKIHARICAKAAVQ